MLVCLTLFIIFQTLPSEAGTFEASFDDPSEVQSGSLLFKSPALADAMQYVSATRLNTDVTINVSGLLVNGKVVQKFRNQTRQWQEALYVFPLPENAAVYGMRIEIDGRLIESEIQPKAHAKKIYDTAKKAGKRAALVEQKRPNIFSTAVANIGPGEEILVRLDYSQSLSYRNSGFELRFPTTITPRYIPGAPLPKNRDDCQKDCQPHANQTGPIVSGWSSNTRQVPDAAEITPDTVEATDVGPDSHRLTMQVDLDPGIPIETIRSATHDLTIQKVNETHIVRLQQTDQAQDRDFVLKWAPTPQAQPESALFTEFDGQYTYGMVMLMPPEVESAQVAGKELVLVIDTSGSMGGVSIRQAKQAITRAIGALRPNDHFNIIQFNSTASQLFTNSRIANEVNKTRAKHYISQLHANGGTEMTEALDLALPANTPNVSDTDTAAPARLRQVVFITDGSVGNENALFSQIQNNLAESRLFTVGIGPAPNSHFMRKAAEFGRGTFIHIDHADEAATKIDTLLQKIQFPALNDIQLTWTNQTDAEVYPERISDLYLGEPVVFSFRVKGHQASGKITGHGLAKQTSEQVLWQRELQIDTVQSSTRQGLNRYWARQKIDSLMNHWNEPAQQAQIEKDVTEIALSHKLVTQFTSLVAVDKTPVRVVNSENDEQELNRSAIPVLLPKGLSTKMLHYPKTATPADLYIIVGFCLLVLAGLAQIKQQHSERN